MTVHRLCFTILIVCCCLISSVASEKRLKLQVPFRRPGFGVGGGEYSGVVMEMNDDKRLNTCAITQAVSALPAGFTQIPSGGLEARQSYKTDYGKLSPEGFVEYNNKNPDMLLQTGPLYGVQYEVSYEVKDSYILYQVKSKLYYSGSDSERWYAYSKKYNDTFFSEKLFSAIKQQLGACAKPN